MCRASSNGPSHSEKIKLYSQEFLNTSDRTLTYFFFIKLVITTLRACSTTNSSKTIGFFLTVFWINILYVFHDIFKKYSFGGYLFFQKLEKYSFLFRYSFFLNLAFFSKSIRCWFIRLYRISKKNSFRRFDYFF